MVWAGSGFDRTKNNSCGPLSGSSANGRVVSLVGMGKMILCPLFFCYWKASGFLTQHLLEMFPTVSSYCRNNFPLQDLACVTFLCQGSIFQVALLFWLIVSLSVSARCWEFGRCLNVAARTGSLLGLCSRSGWKKMWLFSLPVNTNSSGENSQEKYILIACLLLPVILLLS